MPQMQNIRVVEVSLVDLPANKRKFLALKNRGELNMDTLIELIKSTEADNEEELVSALREQGRSDDVIEVTKVMARALEGYRDELSDEDIVEVLKAVGVDVDTEPNTDSDEEEDVPVNKDALPEDAREYIESLEGRVEKSEQTIGELLEERRTEKFVEKAAGFSNLPTSREELANILKSASENMPEDEYDELERILKSLHEQVETGDLFTEKGTSEEDTTPDPLRKMESMAEELVEKSDGELNIGQAIAKVAEDNPKLYKEYVEKKRS